MHHVTEENTLPNFETCSCCEIWLLDDNKHHDLHVVREYARIFVRGHDLFPEANKFPRAKLKENCEL